MATPSATVKASDVEMINGALALEQRTIALYTAGGPLLTGELQKTAGWFLSHELEHAGQLRALLKPLHAKAHSPEARYDFGQPRAASQVLGMLHELERRQIAFYLHAIPRMSTPQLRQALASIMANDAQHITVLRAEQGLSPVTGPFLTAAE